MRLKWGSHCIYDVWDNKNLLVNLILSSTWPISFLVAFLILPTYQKVSSICSLTQGARASNINYVKKTSSFEAWKGITRISCPRRNPEASLCWHKIVARHYKGASNSWCWRPCSYEGCMWARCSGGRLWRDTSQGKNLVLIIELLLLGNITLAYVCFSTSISLLRCFMLLVCHDRAPLDDLQLVTVSFVLSFLVLERKK